MLGQSLTKTEIIEAERISFIFHLSLLAMNLYWIYGQIYYLYDLLLKKEDIESSFLKP